MDTVLITTIFIFGAVIGSFLNVIALRYNSGRSIIKGRSECGSCDEALSARDLIPILSYLFAKGKCRYCSSRFSARYILVEILTGIIFAAIFLSGYRWMEFLFYALLNSLLIIILLYDVAHKIIPNIFVYTFALTALFGNFIDLNSLAYVAPPSLTLLSGPILFALFFLLWFVSHGKWMGLGDGKLALGFGWSLGLSAGVLAIMFGFWIGAVSALSLLLFQKVFQRMQLFGIKTKLTMKSEMPFAPFLIFGYWIVFFFKDVVGALFLPGIL